MSIDDDEGNQAIVSETLKDRSLKYSESQKKKSGIIGALSYVDKAKYDEVGRDDTDESDEDGGIRQSGKNRYSRVSDKKAPKTSMTSA